MNVKQMSRSGRNDYSNRLLIGRGVNLFITMHARLAEGSKERFNIR